ncbi:MAG: DUF401 family protein [Planctomycetota bacterium]|nr:DUF401 family protein [Planctomycetota bacterium]
MPPPVHPGLYALLSIAISLAALAVMLRRKVRLGRAMVVSAIILAWLLGATPAKLWDSLVLEWSAKKSGERTPYLFLSLTSLVILVNILGAAMREAGIDRRLAPALEGLLRSRRAAISIIPLMMGMLPTPGGIMLSAPMVRSAGDGIGLPRARQAAINYWFRHQLEPAWPLFPAVPLVQAMFSVPPGRLLAWNAALSVAGLLAGVAFLLLPGMPPRRDPGPSGAAGGTWANLRAVAAALWPIALAAGLYIGLHMPPAAGIFLGALLILLVYRIPRTRWWPLARESVEWDFALLIGGALMYKLNLDATGAVPEITDWLRSAGLPTRALLFVLPFIVGFVTGVTMPTVAMTFPLLKSFIGEGEAADLGLEALAFSGVLCGLHLTPVHLCVSLSTTYFEAPLIRILWRLVPPTVALAAAGWMLSLGIF